MSTLERPKETRIIVIVGNLGCGKSSMGNIFLGKPRQESFETGLSHPVTQNCQKLQSIRYGKALYIIDTPALNYPEKNFYDIGVDLLQFLDLLPDSGPLAFVYVIDFGRITNEVYNSFCTVKTIIGERFEDHAIVAFTNVNYPEAVFQEKISKYKTKKEEFSKLLGYCKGRCVGFDTENADNNEDQIKDLLTLIEHVTDGGKNSVSRKTFEDATKVLQDMKDRYDKNVSFQHQETVFKRLMNGAGSCALS